MEPKRILQVVTIMNRGGLETMLMNYYRKMDRSKIQFDFMVHRTEKGHYDEEILKLGGQIFHMPQIKPGNYRKYFKSLDQFFLKHPEFHIVHSHINENSSFVLRSAKKIGIPIRIAHSHLSDLGMDFKFPFRIYARLLMKDSPNHYFACSEKAGKWLFGKNTNDVIILNNAVNADEFSFNQITRNNVRSQLGIKDELVIGHVGRFNKQKNHNFLIDIFKSVNDKLPESILLLIGDGHLRSEIEKKVMNLGLSSKVKFLGVRDDIPDLMQAMDLFLFPSLFEGLPVVLVEGQAAGLRCVVSDTITKETDVTGRVHFVSLRSHQSEWANIILSLNYEHANTLNDLRENGYDAKYMAEWLSDYYSKDYQAK
ncbi:glycosyltransferase family 1 protein [Peribacillus sp. NPDC046944]|uniref:glycosyltransferase family 1 protein n=1 Tax=unclassified Peribacillus TaxID=2675266 RepID=UPI003D08C1BE